MKVITGNPIIINDRMVSNRSMYLSANGKTTTAKPQAKPADSKMSKEEAIAKAKAGFESARQAGIFQKGGLRNWLGGGAQPVGDTTIVTTTPPPPPQKEGMSTGAKIGIAVGVLAVVGIIIYAVKKGK